jgi:hypothetical protein
MENISLLSNVQDINLSCLADVSKPSHLDRHRKISSTDLEECARVLKTTRVLVDCLRNHGLRETYLDCADSSILNALPVVIDFLRALSFDVDDYLASTPFSHEWLREHGHGD